MKKNSQSNIVENLAMSLIFLTEKSKMFKTKETIITHNGQSHIDEILAISLILYNEKGNINKIKRVGRDDICLHQNKEKNCWVVDAGLEHNPSKKLFDHHQIPADSRKKTPKCSFSLVMQYYGKFPEYPNFYEKLKTCLPEIKNIEQKDCNSLVAVANTYQISTQDVLDLGSPVEKMVLDLFSCKTTITPKHFVWKLMERIGYWYMLQYKKICRMETLMKNCLRRIYVDNNLILDASLIPEKDLYNFNIWAQATYPEAIGCISNYRSGKNMLTLYRFAPGKGRIDFSLIKNEPNVIFAHVNGYMAKISNNLTYQQITKLLDLCTKKT